MIVEKPVTLRELGPDVNDVAREQQQILRFYFPSESHECQGIQGQGYCHFAANDFRMLSRIGYSRYRYRPVEYRAPKMSAQ